MIVVGPILAYGVTGKKIEELKSYLKQNMEYRYVEDLKGFEQIKSAIQRKVEELNAKYKKTVPIVFKGNVDKTYNTSGYLKFYRHVAYHSILNLPVWYVNEYRKEVEHD